VTQSEHDRARQLIVQSGLNRPDLSADEQAWLQKHLDQCTPCRQYVESAERVVRDLRSVPVAADARLVRATQMRVRFHAARLRQTHERMWLISIACLGVGISAAITAPLFWRLFAWMGEQAGLSNPVWQAGFAIFWIAPALAVSLLLLARGTHSARHPQKHREMS
jgi:predicted anti-sigma-YlaC factor YlaD